MDAIPLLKFLVLERLPFAIAVIVIAWVSLRLATRWGDRAAERFARRRLQYKQGLAVARFVVVLVATVVALGSILQLTDEVLLALGGSAAVAIGFAFKDLVASVMSGILLLFDRPFQVGDRISFGGEYGEVVEIGLRSVRLRTLDDNIVSIPNNQFLNDRVSCANAGALHQMCVFDFYIGCNEDFERAKVIVYEATGSSRFVYLKKPIRVGVLEAPVPDGAERFAIRIRVRAYVLDGRYERTFRTDVVERVKRAFRAVGLRTVGEIEWGAAGTT